MCHDDKVYVPNMILGWIQFVSIRLDNAGKITQKEVLHTQIIDCEWIWCTLNMDWYFKNNRRRMAGRCLNPLCRLWAPVIRRYPSLQTVPADQGVLRLPGSRWVQDYPVEIKQSVVKGYLHCTLWWKLPAFVKDPPNTMTVKASIWPVHSCQHVSYCSERSSLS